MQGSSSDMPCRILGNFFCFFCVLIDILLFLQMIVLKNIFFKMSKNNINLCYRLVC